jgi:DNA-binding MarR family transcriptional regulator
VPSETEDRILAYLSGHAGTPEQLAEHLGISTEELAPILEEMEARGWINAGVAAWYHEPASAITVVALMPAGREEANRRRILSGESELEVVVVSRDELIAELKRRGWTEERIARDPTLRHQRFHFWPGVCGWAGLPDDA